MIHTTEDFFNKVAVEVRTKYFPTEDHGRTENPKYHTVSRTLELFSNGCLTYRKLIGRLAKACDTTTLSIDTLVSKYVVSFGSYRYKPNK